ncbi:aromatic-L-amino-acid decarboxylase [Elysia marginata]|uniref:Aromatic-L-amino-acid decarboxylase n=1 Tax=Elysia marginata TaxID=1093978 RepID=A0AAV4EVS8_9GAST|nr:aromatic-L-amino-acid decarboxylase [Elysia marginata]
MDAEEFRTRGRQMVDYVADYLETIGSRRPLPDVTPGYLRELIPNTAPDKGENFNNVMADLDRVIMPGLTHWHSPQFHAYFPASNSFPALLGDILSGGLGAIGFTWASNPACTELELVMMDWLGKMLQLPSHFLYSESVTGGGIIQSSSSESALMALLCARTEVIRKLQKHNPDMSKGQVLDKLVAYTSIESHSCIERAAMIGLVTIRVLPSDDHGALRGATLEKAVKEDKAKGNIPFYLGACIGTTTRCTFDNLKELGPICTDNNMWMHIDAAYAGSACICPEFRYILDGIEHADSFALNPHKWLQVNHDCTAMWVKDKDLMEGAFHIDYYILRHVNNGVRMPDFRHWQIPFGRRFRSLKLWFVMRSFGVSGLQATIRKDVSLAKHFESLVRADSRFEIVAEVVLGLVCFRLKGDNNKNERLNQLIKEDGRIHMTPSKVKDMYFLRFAICATRTQEADVNFAWDIVQAMANKVIAMSNGITNGFTKHG